VRFRTSAPSTANSCAAAAKSNDALRQLGPDIQWIEGFVAENKTFCVYLTVDEGIIRKHAEISGFPPHQDHRSAKNDRPHDFAPAMTGWLRHLNQRRSM